MTRAAFVTNIPAPYRERVHAAVAAELDYHVVYAAEREPNRQWDVEAAAYPRTFLRERFLAYRGRYIHVQPEIWGVLDRLDPAVVITTGFNPTMLLAFAWAVRRRRAHVPFSDAWRGSEAHLSFVHRAVRRAVYARSAAFIGASAQTLELFASYGAPPAALFRTLLCVDNARFAVPRRPAFDLMFCGRIADGKRPLFFADVAARVARERPGLRALIVGDGPDREALLARLRSDGVAFEYAGFVSQRDLPARYASAKLLLFPTEQDAWGIVANEASAAGVPVVTCPAAGAAGELVADGETGVVLPLDAGAWAEAVLGLLADDRRRERLGDAARERVQTFTFEGAARGIVAAIEHAELC